MSYYHCTHLDLKAGDLIQPGNWGGLIFKHGPNHGSWRREMMLEAVRAEFYPDKPSRLYSCFGCYTIEAITFYRDHNCPDGFIYEVDFSTPNAPMHTGDFNAVEPHPSWNVSMFQTAHDYWNLKCRVRVTDFEHVDCLEFITPSALKIIRKV